MEEDVFEFYKILQYAKKEKRFVIIGFFGNQNEYSGYVKFLNHEYVVLENKDFLITLKLQGIMRVHLIKIDLDEDDIMDFLKEQERENRNRENGR